MNIIREQKSEAARTTLIPSVRDDHRAMRTGLDHIDSQILSLFQKNAIQSLCTLAQSLDVSSTQFIRNQLLCSDLPCSKHDVDHIC
jgi:hypothetical protein